MRIEELHLKNFRCFKELDIQFPKSNLAVLIGLNGAGKTAILDAITLLLDNCPQRKIVSNPNQEITLKYNVDDILTNESEVRNEIVFNIQNNISIWETFRYRSHIKYTLGLKRKKSNEHIISSNEFLCIYYKTNRQEIYTITEGTWNLSNPEFEWFYKWFIEQENLENEWKLEYRNFEYTNLKLDVIRKAINIFFSYISGLKYSNLKAKRKIESSGGSFKDDLENLTNYLVIKLNDSELKLSQLSSGQRLLLLLIADIAFKLADTEIPDKIKVDNILERSGIVLIDEIELHLHPQWQREVLPALQKTFPNIQFIVTTHSPQVLSRVHKDDIFILKDNQIFQPSSNPIGRDSADIMNEVMGEPKRPPDIQELTDEYFSLINRKLFDEAQAIREKLLKKPYTLDKKDPLFIRADAMMTRMQLLKK